MTIPQDSNLHPRDNTTGKYADKLQSPPEAGLAAVNKPRPALPGDRVMVGDRPAWVTSIDNGTYLIGYPNGDQSLETSDTAVLHEEPADLPDAPIVSIYQRSGSDAPAVLKWEGDDLASDTVPLAFVDNIRAWLGSKPTSGRIRLNNWYYAVVNDAAEVAREDRAHAIEKERIAISSLHGAAAAIPREKAEDIVWTQHRINDGAWSELRNGAQVALIDAKIHGQSDLWLEEQAAQIDAIRYSHIRELDTVEYGMFAAAGDAAEALAARHLIGQTDGWTQEGYDHLTRPWRENVGQVHPDDEQRPESWSKRPTVPYSTKRAFDADLQKINAVIDERDALIIDEDEGWTGVDQEKLGPELSSTYAKLQQFGYANDLF